MNFPKSLGIPKTSKLEKKVIALGIEVAFFLQELHNQDNTSETINSFDVENLVSASSYAEAVYTFQKEGVDPEKWYFSCDNELLLKYAKNLKEKYQVGILSIEDGMKREKLLKEENQAVIRGWNFGMPKISNEYHQGGEISDKEWYFRKPVKKD